MQPSMIILTSFVLSLAGVTLPLLMVIHVLRSTFAVNFLSFTGLVLGLVLGILGASLYIQENRDKFHIS